MNWQNSLVLENSEECKKNIEMGGVDKNDEILFLANCGLPRLLLLLIKTLKMKQKTSATLLKTANATKTI